MGPLSALHLITLLKSLVFISRRIEVLSGDHRSRSFLAIDKFLANSSIRAVNRVQVEIEEIYTGDITALLNQVKHHSTELDAMGLLSAIENSGAHLPIYSG
jgi:hypothetical protein